MFQAENIKKDSPEGARSGGRAMGLVDENVVGQVASSLRGCRSPSHRKLRLREASKIILPTSTVRRNNTTRTPSSSGTVPKCRRNEAQRQEHPLPVRRRLARSHCRTLSHPRVAMVGACELTADEDIHRQKWVPATMNLFSHL